MVLHDHQANPHVHISARAESKHGKRLNPRKADLHRWRETFAEKLRERGVEAEATRQPTRGRNRNYDPLWRIKAREDGRLRSDRANTKSGPKALANRNSAVEAWRQIARALAESGERSDRNLAASITTYMSDITAFDSPARDPGALAQPQPVRGDLVQDAGGRR